MTNGQIAELLARACEQANGNPQKALRRASRMALTWQQEAADLAERHELTTLEGVGPHLERLIIQWLEEGAEVPSPPEVRSGFLTRIDVRRILQRHPGLQIKGDLQSHTIWSDGGATVAELAAEAEAKGFSYQAVTDHSKGLKIAGGLDEAQLARQGHEIQGLNDRYASSGFRLLRSVEMNLNLGGEGDMDPASLERLDIVLGSFHSKLRVSQDQTERYLAALGNRDLHILGHPQGRMYNSRTGLSADWPRVFAHAASYGKAVEVDAFPDRQDLKMELLRIAAEEGAMVSIGSDAHRPGQLSFVDFGLAAALEAGIAPDRILNLKPAGEILAWVQELRALAGAASDRH